MRPRDEIIKQAMDSRRVYIWDEITDDVAGHFIERVEFYLSKSREPIYVIIHSPGGLITAECAIVDEIDAVKHAGVMINTICVGIAYSAAACILAMGTKGHRYVRSFSSVMLHPSSYSLNIDYSGNQEKVQEFLKKREDVANRTMAEACGMGKKYNKFLKDIDKGLWMSATEAINYGIADKIWKGPLPYAAEQI